MSEPMTPAAYESGDIPRRILCSRDAHRRQKRHTTVIGLVLGGVILTVIWGILLSQALHWDTWAKAWQELRQRVPEITLWRILPLISCSMTSLIAIYSLYINQYARLILTPSGLVYRSPLPRYFQWLHPSWVLCWQDVNSIYLQRSWTMPTPESTMLVFETGAQRRTLVPLHWVDLADVKPVSTLSLGRTLQHAHDQWLQETFLSTPILQHLTAVGLHVNIDIATLRAAPSFALESSPHAVAVVLLALSLFLYATVDFVVNEETYATWLPLTYYISTGLAATGLGTLWLRRARVPVAESIGVALVLGVTVGTALYPGLLRFNQLTDSVGLRPYTYVLQADHSLRPVDPALPTLRFTENYWKHSAEGSEHILHVRRGGLGFYQVDMGPVYARHP